MNGGGMEAWGLLAGPYFIDDRLDGFRKAGLDTGRPPALGFAALLPVLEK